MKTLFIDPEAPMLTEHSVAEAHIGDDGCEVSLRVVLHDGSSPSVYLDPELATKLGLMLIEAAAFTRRQNQLEYEYYKPG